MSLRVAKDVFVFNGAMKPPVIASLTHGPWASKTVQTGGSPTVAAAAGSMDLTLDATNEVQNACLYFGDVLPYSIDKIVQVDIWAKLTASLNAAISAAFGLASARNDAIASITNRALFRCVGNNNVLAEASDGTNTQASIATGQTLVATFKRFTLSFREGIQTMDRANSLGGKARIGFACENTQGNLRVLAPNTQFNMSAYSSGLQLFAQIQKTAAAAGAVLSIRRCEVQYLQE